MVTLEFELEDLKTIHLLMKIKGGELVEGRLVEFVKGNVKIDLNTEEGYKWVPEADIEVVDILFR
jgi:hypothetical protein